MTSSIYPLTAPSWMVRQAILLPGVHDLITRSKTTHLAKQKAQMNPRCSSGGLRIVIKAVNCSMSLWKAYLTAVSHCGLGQLLYLKHESRLRPASLEMCWWAERVVLLRSISGTFWGSSAYPHSHHMQSRVSGVRNVPCPVLPSDCHSLKPPVFCFVFVFRLILSLE